MQLTECMWSRIALIIRTHLYDDAEESWPNGSVPGRERAGRVGEGLPALEETPPRVVRLPTFCPKKTEFEADVRG